MCTFFSRVYVQIQRNETTVKKINTTEAKQNNGEHLKFIIDI